MYPGDYALISICKWACNMNKGEKRQWNGETRANETESEVQGGEGSETRAERLKEARKLQFFFNEY